MLQRQLLGLLFVVPLAAFGGTYRWLTLPLLLLATLAALVDIRALGRAAREWRALDLTLLAGCAAVALQLVPLPPALLEWLSPHASRVRQSLRLDRAGSADAWLPLSTDPEATVHAAALVLTATITFWVARSVFTTGGVRRWSRLLALIGLAISIAAVVQRAVSPELIYGFWRPLDEQAVPFGPFVNRNHFAAWLLLATPVVAGYLAAHASIHLTGVRGARQYVQTFAVAGTPIYATAALVMIVTIVLTLSRSALAGIAASAVVAGIAARHRVRSAGWSTLLGVVAIVSIALFAFVDFDRLAARMDDALRVTPDSRMVIWRETLPMTRDFWIAGVGAGAYRTAMLAYQRTDLDMYFNQAHSQYLQVMTEGGALVVVPWLVAAALFTRAAWRALGSDKGAVFWIRLGAVASLVGIAVQCIWETPLRMGANAVLAASIAALVIHRRVTETGDASTRPSRRSSDPSRSARRGTPRVGE